MKRVWAYAETRTTYTERVCYAFRIGSEKRMFECPMLRVLIKENAFSQCVGHKAFHVSVEEKGQES